MMGAGRTGQKKITKKKTKDPLSPTRRRHNGAMVQTTGLVGVFLVRCTCCLIFFWFLLLWLKPVISVWRISPRSDRVRSCHCAAAFSKHQFIGAGFYSSASSETAASWLKGPLRSFGRIIERFPPLRCLFFCSNQFYLTDCVCNLPQITHVHLVIRVLMISRCSTITTVA